MHRQCRLKDGTTFDLPTYHTMDAAIRQLLSDGASRMRVLERVGLSATDAGTRKALQAMPQERFVRLIARNLNNQWGDDRAALPRESSEAALVRAATLLREADAVVITAGAGMSIPAGIDYTSREIFAERYPAMLQHGPRRCYDMFGFAMPNQRLRWGYNCTHGWYSTHHIPETDQTYQTLRALIAQKAHTVATTNADGLFERIGFAKDAIYTPQGSYSKLQCRADGVQGCGHVWSSLPTIENVLAADAQGDAGARHGQVPDPHVSQVRWCLQLQPQRRALLHQQPLGGGQAEVPGVHRLRAR